MSWCTRKFNLTQRETAAKLYEKLYEEGFNPCWIPVRSDTTNALLGCVIRWQEKPVQEEVLQ